MSSSQIAAAKRLASAFYLIYFAAMGACWPYFTLYYQSVGMTTAQIGTLAALPTVMTLFSGPAWSLLADRLNLRRHLLPLILAGTILPALLLTQARSFEALAGLILAWMFMIAPVGALADSSILDILGDARESYGPVRMWGAVGFGLSSWISGVLAERMGLEVGFVLFAVLMGGAVLVARRLPIPTLLPVEPFFVSLRKLITNQSWLVFLGAIFLAGTAYAMSDAFLSIHLTARGAGESLIGLMSAVAALSELPVFLFSPWLIRRFSARGLLLISFVVYGVRAFGYSILPSPDWVLAVNLLHGLSFSAMWTAGVIYVSRIAPPSLGASAQAAFGAVFMGLGRAAGALLGAQVYEALGGESLFRLSAAGSILGAILFALTIWRSRQAAPAGGVPATD